MNQYFNIKNNKRNVSLSTFKRKDIATLGVNNTVLALNSPCLDISHNAIFPIHKKVINPVYFLSPSGIHSIYKMNTRSFSSSPPCSGAYKNAMLELELLDDVEDMDDFFIYSDYNMGHYLDDDILCEQLGGTKQSGSDKRNKRTHIIELDRIQIDKRIIDPKSALYRKTVITK